MSTPKDLDLLLRSFVEKGLPGCGLMITQHGKTLYEHYEGFADPENGIPVTERSVFRMASMSKIPMYTALMMLYERGCFNLTDPISDFLPEWEQSYYYVQLPNGDYRVEPCKNKITIGDTLSMKCGLPYCNSQAPTKDRTLQSMQECMKPLIEKGHYTNREHVRAMSKAILAFEPGTHWIYGFSSELAVAVIEAVTGKGVDDVMKEFLFDPLGMDETRSRYFGDIQSRMVKLYAIGEDGSLKPGPGFFDDKHLPGAEHEQGWARLFSTVRDYSRLMAMLSNGGVYEGKHIMGRRTIDLMRANGLNETQLRDFDGMYNAGYGYGYGVRTIIDPAKGNLNGSLGAFGWTGGFGTWCEADPSEGVGIVYMHNLMPNMEEYYHHLVRTAAYGLIE